MDLFQPSRGYILVTAQDTEEKTPSGIVINVAKRPILKALVLAVGDVPFSSTGEEILGSAPCILNDIIVVKRTDLLPMEFLDKNTFLIPFSSVLGVVEDPFRSIKTQEVLNAPHPPSIGH